MCHLSPLSLPRFVILNAHPLSAHLQSNSPLPNRVYYVVYVYTYPPPPLSISPMQSVTTTLPLSLPSKHGNFLRPLSTLHKPPLSRPPMSVFLPPEKAPSRKRVPRKKLGEVKGGRRGRQSFPRSESTLYVASSHVRPMVYPIGDWKWAAICIRKTTFFRD